MSPCLGPNSSRPPDTHFKSADLVRQQLLQVLRTISCSLELLPSLLCGLPLHQSLSLGQEVGQEDLTRETSSYVWKRCLSFRQRDGLPAPTLELTVSRRGSKAHLMTLESS